MFFHPNLPHLIFPCPHIMDTKSYFKKAITGSLSIIETWVWRFRSCRDFLIQKASGNTKIKHRLFSTVLIYPRAECLFLLVYSRKGGHVSKNPNVSQDLWCFNWQSVFIWKLCTLLYASVMGTPATMPSKNHLAPGEKNYTEPVVGWRGTARHSWMNCRLM